MGKFLYCGTQYTLYILTMSYDALTTAGRHLLSAEAFSFADDGKDAIKDFEWIIVLGALLCFCTAFGIGANDVANAFATSVGSGAVSIKLAILLAAVCEFTGALFMGSHVTEAIRKGIADYKCFQNDPALMMYGCLCVLSGDAGFDHALVRRRDDWYDLGYQRSKVRHLVEESGEFPYVKGVSAIVVSWLLSPIVSGVFAFALFFSIRTLVMRRPNSYNLARYLSPC